MTDTAKTAKHDPSRNEYMREYQLKKYHKRMKAAKKALGGQCATCGSTRNLQLDHRDPDGKEFVVSKLWSVPEAEFNKEVKKCRLLCKSCHGKHTGKQREKGEVTSTPGKTDYDSKGRKKHKSKSKSKKKASMDSLITRIDKVASSSKTAYKTIPADATADELAKWAKSDDEDERAQVAKHPNATQPILMYLSSPDDAEVVRMYVAHNENTGSETLHRLALKDLKTSVRRAALMNPTTSEATLVQAAQREKVYDLRRVIAQLADCPVVALSFLAQDEDATILADVIANPNITSQILAEMVKTLSKVQGHNKGYGKVFNSAKNKLVQINSGRKASLMSRLIRVAGSLK